MGSDLEGGVPPWPSGGLTLAWIRFTATASLGSREAVATSRAKSVRVIVNRAASAACCTLT